MENKAPSCYDSIIMFLNYNLIGSVSEDPYESPRKQPLISKKQSFDKKADKILFTDKSAQISMINLNRSLQIFTESSIGVDDDSYDNEEEENVKVNKKDYAKMMSEKYKEKGKIFKFILNFAGIKDEIVSLLLENFSIIHEKCAEDVMEVENDEIAKLRMACRNIKDTYEELSSLILDEIRKITIRFDAVEKKIQKNPQYQQELISLKFEIQEVQQNTGNLFSSSVSKLKTLFKIQEKLSNLEKSLISPLDDAFTLLKFKDLEKNLKALGQKSLSNMKKIENELKGSTTELSPKIISMMSGDLNLESYFTLSDSLLALTTPLLAFESIKEGAISSNVFKKTLRRLDKTFVGYFKASERIKESSFFRLKKMFQFESKGNMFMHEDILLTDIRSNSLFSTIKDLLEKISRILSILTEQDNIFEELFEKTQLFEDIFYEIDLKLFELLSFDMRDLAKAIPGSQTETKDLIKKIMQEISSLQENPPIDIMSHLKEILDILKTSHKTIEIKSKLREIHQKEISSIKQESLEKIKNLSTAYDTINNYKNNIESALEITKASLEKSRSLVDKLSKDSSEKELEICSCKNEINSLAEELSEVNNKYDQLTSLADEMTIQVRTYQKLIRKKDRELQDLKSCNGLITQRLTK
ncbi:hypothetical protein SteCoe_4243 [Stentor coeruleus]|uniref:Uncharacterized protein n=1 Tax=Stentor coeruleus TaxID=5963 RepID=A0A1R2CV66_9CILI|nr:hypothetical protein SteCoe_4243 [Stentor coeruleus]